MWFAVVLIWLAGDTGDPDKLFFQAPFRSQAECVAQLDNVRAAFDDFLKEREVDKRDLRLEFSCEPRRDNG